MVDVIGSIVISLSRCCLPNDEGPAPSPQYFFLEPPLQRGRHFLYILQWNANGKCWSYGRWVCAQPPCKTRRRSESAYIRQDGFVDGDGLGEMGCMKEMAGELWEGHTLLKSGVSAHRHIHRQTDRQTDRHTKVKTVYPPVSLRSLGGYKNPAGPTEINSSVGSW